MRHENSLHLHPLNSIPIYIHLYPNIDWQSTFCYQNSRHWGHSKEQSTCLQGVHIQIEGFTLLLRRNSQNWVEAPWNSSLCTRDTHIMILELFSNEFWNNHRVNFHSHCQLVNSSVSSLINSCLLWPRRNIESI